MAITYTENDVNSGAAAVASITSGNLSVTVNDIITVMLITADNGSTGTISSISNVTGTALSWNVIFITNTASNCKVACWWAKATNTENTTVKVVWGGGSVGAMLSCRVHTGAHQTNPIPSGNIFNGVGGHNVSQAITPTASGSALWMACGDWAATNTFAAISNCTLEATFNWATEYTGTIIRPTTQPRTDGLAFTIGETDSAATVAWIAYEVQAAVATSMPIAWII